MRSRTMCLLAFAMTVMIGFAFAQAKKALTNDDVIQMVKAGFDDETVIKAIQASDLQFDTSAVGLITLKNAGVSKKIIDAMLEAEAKTRATAPPEAVAPGAAVETKGVTGASHQSVQTTASSEEAWPEEVAGMPRDIGLYYKKEGKFVRIFGVPVAGTSGGSFKQSALPFSGHSQRGEVGGKHSQVQITERQPIFYAYIPENYEPGSSSLMRLDVKGDRREFQVGSVSGMSGRHRSGLDPKKIEQCTTERIAQRLLRVTPARELEDGEYAFISNYMFTTRGVAGAGEKIYDFGISKKK